MSSNKKKYKQSKALALFTYLSYYIFMQCFVIKICTQKYNRNQKKEENLCCN